MHKGPTAGSRMAMGFPEVGSASFTKMVTLVLRVVTQSSNHLQSTMLVTNKRMWCGMQGIGLLDRWKLTHLLCRTVNIGIPTISDCTVLGNNPKKIHFKIKTYFTQNRADNREYSRVQST